MVAFLAMMFVTATLAALMMPLLGFLAAGFGLCEPFEIDLFGRTWKFHPWPWFAKIDSAPVIGGSDIRLMSAAIVVIAVVAATEPTTQVFSGSLTTVGSANSLTTGRLPT